jgi:hypothetical protein
MVPGEWAEHNSPKKPLSVVCNWHPRLWKDEEFRNGLKRLVQTWAFQVHHCRLYPESACAALHFFFSTLGWDFSDGHTLASCTLCAVTWPRPLLGLLSTWALGLPSLQWVGSCCFPRYPWGIGDCPELAKCLEACLSLGPGLQPSSSYGCHKFLNWSSVCIASSLQRLCTCMWGSSWRGHVGKVLKVWGFCNLWHNWCCLDNMFKI